MYDTYKRMQAEGKIGPFDAQGRPRPFAEYPKLVTNNSGKKVTVNSQREELAIAGEAVPGVAIADDPVLLERNRLAQENDDLRAQLAAIASAKPKTTSPPAPTTKTN
jgi:hypothetical protein